MLKQAHDIDIAKSHNQSRAHLITSHISCLLVRFCPKGETRLDSVNPPTVGKLSEVSFAAFPRWGWDGGVGMAGGLTCFTLDGSGPVPFPGSFFLPLAFPAALFSRSPFFHLCFTFFLPFFHLCFTFLLAFPREKLTFQGPEGGGAGGKKKVSGKGKTRWHPHNASARGGRGTRFATTPPSAAQFGRWWGAGGVGM